MNVEERVKREKYSHENDDVLNESLKLKSKYSHILSYPGYKTMTSRFEKSYDNLLEKVVLDFGCGKGLDSLKLLKAGATVYGIDIAENYINETIQLAKNNGFSEKYFNFKVMDAHKLEFEENKFDLVIGNGILHHLDKLVAIKSIYKVLKPGGRLVFKEPLADNPLLKIFRFFTPKARTEDEEPFSKNDLTSLKVISSLQNEIFLSYEKSKLNMEELINFIKKNHAKIIDLSTDDGDLEDVFLRLTKN